MLAHLKKYRVLCWRTYYGYYEVEAKNEDEAERKAYQHLWNRVELDGVNNMEADISEIQRQ